MNNSSECPTCREHFLLPFGPKTNQVLQKFVEEKYPNEVKRKKDDEEAEIRSGIVGKIIGKSFVTIPKLCMIPGECGILKFRSLRNEEIEEVKHGMTEFGIVSDYLNENGALCGVAVIVTSMDTVYEKCMAIKCMTRIRMIQEIPGGPIKKGIFMTFDDFLPADEEKKEKTIKEAVALEELYKSKLANAPEIIINILRKRGLAMPKFDLDAKMNDKLIFAKEMSMHVAAQINVKETQPKIIYTRDTLERINMCKKYIEENENLAVLFGLRRPGFALRNFLMMVSFIIAIILGSYHFNR